MVMPVGISMGPAAASNEFGLYPWQIMVALMVFGRFLASIELLGNC
jgi:hypothetical protein